MSRLFYHVCQDNAGNLLFNVSGTMRLAGTGTLATIYGDEALTVVLPNPMTNHPSFGSFKCFLGVGDYDFSMAKPGYTFETLTGVQGSGTMADQNANAVAITGGSVQTSPGSLGAGAAPNVAFDLVTGTLPAYMGGNLGLGINPPTAKLDVNGTTLLRSTVQMSAGVGIGAAPQALARVYLEFARAAQQGLWLKPTDGDTGGFATIVFTNTAGTPVGTITQTAAATAYNTSSDHRLKHAITPLTGALDVVRALNPVAFLWKADGSPGRGLVAQEVAEVVPGVVSGDEARGDVLGIDYSKLVPYLIGAVKELTQQVEMLQAQVAEAGA